MLGGVCEGAGGAEGEVDSYGGGGWNVINSTNQHTSTHNCGETGMGKVSGSGTERPRVALKTSRLRFPRHDVETSADRMQDVDSVGRKRNCCAAVFTRVSIVSTGTIVVSLIDVSDVAVM